MLSFEEWPELLNQPHDISFGNRLAVDLNAFAK